MGSKSRNDWVQWLAGPRKARGSSKVLEINANSAKAHDNWGFAYLEKGQYDWTISDFTKAFEINPRDAAACKNRGLAYYFRKEYGEAWENVKKAQSLGYQIDPKFLDQLRKASGGQNSEIEYTHFHPTIFNF